MGGPYSLKEIRNMIPLHPNCRCIALPKDVTDVDKPEDIHENIIHKENSIRNDELESVHIYNKEGDNLFSKQGQKGHVPFTTTDLIKAREKGGNIITHNHPRIPGGVDSTFSVSDITLVMKYDMQEIRAVTKNKTYRFVKTPNSKGAGGGNFGRLKVNNNINGRLQNNLDILQEELREKDIERYRLMLNGTKKQKQRIQTELLDQASDRTWKQIANEYNWDYIIE